VSPENNLTYLLDTSGYNSDIIGISWVTFDNTTKTSTGSSRIFVGVASLNAPNVYVTEDAGSTCKLHLSKFN
jgi:xyloglucan-specific exo-beta-1,4-glucanase